MRRVYWLLAIAGLLTGIVVLLLVLAPRVTGHAPAAPAAPWEPILIEFNRPVDPESVAGRFTLDPDVPGQLLVDGGQIVFEPERPWDYDQTYTVTLESGIRAQGGLPLLRGEQWSFAAGQPQLLYLLEQEGIVNLWRDDEARDRRRLTDEVDGVWDYAPLPNGRGLVYSAFDVSDDTIDLFWLSSAGERELLLDCQDALCRSPSSQPGGRLVAYERQPLDGELNDTELWLLDLDSGETVPAPVPQDLATAGYEAPLGRHASWSPDGRRLAAYRPDANMIVIADFSATGSAEPLTIPANLESMAGWSPDGRSLAYTELAFGKRQPHEHVDENGVVISHTRPSLYQHVVVVKVDGRQATDISAGLEMNEGRPAWHPSGEILAVPRTTTGAGKQLFLVPLDGDEATQLTDDPFFNHAALAWSPDGRYLAFMRLPRADGSANPTVMLYDSKTGEFREVAQGAFQPGWWP